MNHALILGVLSICIFSCGSSDPQPASEAKLESIRIEKTPSHLYYALNEALDLGGLQVYGNYDDGTKRPITVTGKEVSGYKAEQPSGTLVLTVTVEGKTATFEVHKVPVTVEKGVLKTLTGDDYATLTLPENVVEIGAEAFKGKKIKKVVLPPALQRIGNDAFFKSALEEIDFPPALTAIGSYAFAQCARLKEVNLKETQITEIPQSAFELSAITKIELPAVLKKIGIQAFQETRGLTAVTIPEKVEQLEIEAFRGSGIREVRLPNRIRDLKDRAFYKCEKLTTVSAYGEKPSGNEVAAEEMPGIGNSCFERCPEIDVLHIPASIRVLNQNMLTHNVKLKAITLPAAITTIHFRALANTQIQTVTMKGTEPPVISSEVFPSSAAIKVPAASVEKYKSASGWSAYSGKIEAVK